MSEQMKPTDSPADPLNVPPSEEVERYYGKCKWFNVVKGFGFIVDDITGEDLFVHQTHLNMKGFRSLETDERVSYFVRQREGKQGREAYGVSAEDDGKELVGSSIRPMGHKKHKNRCYCCGLLTNHKAKNCPLLSLENNKVCYTCRSSDHLSSVCPLRQVKKEVMATQRENIAVRKQKRLEAEAAAAAGASPEGQSSQTEGNKGLAQSPSQEGATVSH